MKRRISLFINDRKVDLDDESFILFNYAFEDLGNPAIVKNSFSQQVNLPKTPTNNRIFGHLGKTDRTIVNGSFNPLQREPFAIFNEMSEMLEAGYVKVDSIDDKYHITLYGGLGGFFYFLSYKDGGEKKSLADLYYQYQGVNPFLASALNLAIDKDIVAEAWESLEDGDTGVWSLINFATCYNGYPSAKFSTDKAVYKAGTQVIPDLYNYKYQDYKAYNAKEGANGAILLELEHNHTELDMQDMRSYLQRPVLSLKRLLEAFTLSQNTGEYTFVIDSSVNTLADDWIDNGWMTLRMFDRDNLDPASFTMADLLSKTATPADYLIGFAKMYGLVFAYDNPTKTITLKTRDSFFGGDVIDLSRRIDLTTSPIVKPFVFDRKYYVWQTGYYGAGAKAREELNGRRDGSVWVNTSYDYSTDKTDVLDGIVYKGATDTRESDRHFFVVPAERNEDGTVKNYATKFKTIEKVSWKLYHTEGTTTEEESFEPLKSLYSAGSGTGKYMFYYYQGTPSDWMQRIELHDKDNKGEDGDNVLLFFNGMVDTPSAIDTDGTAPIYIPIEFHLSDDTEEMLLLNNGQPCWDISPDGDNILKIDKMPSFLRNGYGKTFDFSTSTGLFATFWENYIADRYDKDTKIMSCKVNLSGLQVDKNLLGRFFWYDNSLWVVNKIINHSLTTYDMVECEFIQVKDMDNYTNGQE